MPRYYTIASSSLMYPDEVRIAISLTTDILPNGEAKMGLTSRYLQETYENVRNFETTVVKNRIFIKDSLFRLPPDNSTQMIMVGPGTGVVPFIGFMQDRQMKFEADPTIQFGDAYLFFGCRKSTSDFIYQDQIAKSKSSHHLKDVFIAFSREDSSKRVYV